MPDLLVETTEGLALRGSRCTSCRRAEFPARSICPACQSPSDPFPLGPHARLGSATSVLHAPPGAQVTVPYTVAVARFDGNLSVLGLLDSDPGPEPPPPDTPLEVVSYVLDDGSVSYAFRLRSGR
jgi:uncharacterized OB-fold protein